MDADFEPHHPHDPTGERALAAGVVAVVASLFPMIGDYVAVPAAIVAIVLGFLGIRRFETGRSAKVAAAAAGTILGAVAILLVVIVLTATHLSP